MFTLRTLARSLVGKLLLLLIVFAAVPMIMYDRFQEADAEKRRLLIEALREQGRLMAESLRPLLERSDPSPLIDLPEAVDRLATGDTGIKVLFQPANRTDPLGFYLVASDPPVPPAMLAEERDRLVERGVLDNLGQSCAGGLPIALRYRKPGGGEELLSSITPVTTEAGCWAVITAHAGGAFLGTAIGQPYWQTLEVRFAVIAYLVLVVLTLMVFGGIWRSLMRFRATARAIGNGTRPHGGFEGESRVPELNVVAREFDRMTQVLTRSSEEMRRAAEDNAHALKTPIAVLRQSLEPLRRQVPAQDLRGQRALEMIEASIERLDRLVTAARELDAAVAELLDAPRERLNLSRLVGQILDAYGHGGIADGVTLRPSLAPGVVVLAGGEVIETVVENVLDNAVSVSPHGEEIAVDLKAERGEAVLTISDRGPGVNDVHLERIFERYVSLRAPNQEQNGVSHFGIGLWIARRNLEAVGGSIHAQNRLGGGLSVVMHLPLAR